MNVIEPCVGHKHPRTLRCLPATNACNEFAPRQAHCKLVIPSRHVDDPRHFNCVFRNASRCKPAYESYRRIIVGPAKKAEHHLFVRLHPPLSDYENVAIQWNLFESVVIKFFVSEHPQGVFLPSAQEHAPPLAGRASRRELRFLLWMTTSTRRLVAVAVPRLVGLFFSGGILYVLLKPPSFTFRFGCS